VADFNDLTYFHLIGRYNGIVGDTTGTFGDPGTNPDLYNVNMSAVVALVLAGADGKPVPGPPELRLTTATPPRTLLLLPINASVESGVLRLPGSDTGIDGIDLVAKSPILSIPAGNTLLCEVTFGPTTIGGNRFQFDPVAFEVPQVLPADYHANFVQTITITGNPDGGTWELIYGNTPTATIAYHPTAATVQTALRSLSAIGTAVTVTGATGGPFTATFDTTAIPRPLRLGALDNLTDSTHATAPGVTVTDAYVPVTIDLTTVDRWETF
jgi:hypothetical protein